MKKLCLTLITLLSAFQFLYAQWTISGTNITNTNTGNVGIGNTAPTSLLSIGSSTTRGTLNVTGSTTQAPTIGLSDSQTGGHAYSLYSGLSGPGNFDIFDQNASAYRLTITSSGNIGIGTITPKSALHLYGSFITGGAGANIDPAIAANVPGNLPNTGQMLIGWNRNAGSGETDFIANAGPGAPGGFAFYNHDNSNVETQLMWIRGDGTVGIGTPTPHGYKLAVNGNIHAQQINVDLSNWPDYVFKKGFHLRTLSETAAYIDQNHHLPDMPSEQQVTKDGLNLGEMNKLLVKKVEELTLYLIEKDKVEKAQQSQLDMQKQLLDLAVAELKKQQEQMDRLVKQQATSADKKN